MTKKQENQTSANHRTNPIMYNFSYTPIFQTQQSLLDTVEYKSKLPPEGMGDQNSKHNKTLTGATSRKNTHTIRPRIPLTDL